MNVSLRLEWCPNFDTNPFRSRSSLEGCQLAVRQRCHCRAMTRERVPTPPWLVRQSKLDETVAGLHCLWPDILFHKLPRYVVNFIVRVEWLKDTRALLVPFIFLHNPYFIVQTSGVCWCFTRKSCDVSEDVLRTPREVFPAMEHGEMSGSMVQNLDVLCVSPRIFWGSKPLGASLRGSGLPCPCRGGN